MVKFLHTHASDLWFVVWGCDQPKKKGGGGGGLGGQIPVSCQPLWQNQPVDWFTQPDWRLAISKRQSPPVIYYQYLENDAHWESPVSFWLCFKPNLRPSVQTPPLFCVFFSDDRGVVLITNVHFLKAVFYRMEIYGVDWWPLWFKRLQYSNICMCQLTAKDFKNTVLQCPDLIVRCNSLSRSVVDVFWGV